MANGAKACGVNVSILHLNEYPLPVYDGDQEEAQGLPANVARLQQLFAEHDGLLLTSPEYNGFFTPLLKNTLDWVSRPLADGSKRFGSATMQGKPAGIAAASPGPLGGIRSLQYTRLYLSNLGFMVVPAQMAVGNVGNLFNDANEMVDAQMRASLEAIGAQVARLATLLKS